MRMLHVCDLFSKRNFESCYVLHNLILFYFFTSYKLPSKSQKNVTDYQTTMESTEMVSNCLSSTESRVEMKLRLPHPLPVLFFLNGATLSLPSLAMSSLMNDRIAIPLEYLPAYGAIAFLPYNLKPLYAVAISMVDLSKRHIMLALLFLGSG